MRRGDKGDICRVIRNRVGANLLGGSFPAGLLPESRAKTREGVRGIVMEFVGFPLNVSFRFFRIFLFLAIISVAVVWKEDSILDASSRYFVLQINFNEFSSQIREEKISQQ